MHAARVPCGLPEFRGFQGALQPPVILTWALCAASRHVRGCLYPSMRTKLTETTSGVFGAGAVSSADLGPVRRCTTRWATPT